MAETAAPLLVGQRVRVAPVAADGVSRRALILAFDGEDRAEVEYEKSNGEEDVVPIARCSALMPFEESPAPQLPAAEAAEQHKAYGNSLFKLRDAAAALEQYVLGLKRLQADSPLSTGARCLIRPADGDPAGRAAIGGHALRSAMVLVMEEDGSSDVSYERDDATAQPGGPVGGGGGGGGGGVSQRLQQLLRSAESIDDSDGGAAASTETQMAACSGGGGAAAVAGTEGSLSSRLAGWMPWRWAGADVDSRSGTAGTSRGGQQPEEGEEQGGEEEEEEEEGVARERVVVVVHGRQPALQCALLLNSAKCSLLVRDWGAALARASRAERIAAHDVVEAGKTRLLRRTALAVCARASLGMQRFGRATTYAARLLAADTPPTPEGGAGATKEVRSLLRDIQRRAAEVKRSNQRLAKSVSSWVAAAMEESDQTGELQAALSLQ
jgi:hypothetical protein